MSAGIGRYLGSSVLRKQLVAITGLVMVGFVVAHLSGNLLIYGGPEVFNAYAQKLQDIAPLLWVMRVGLIVSTALHIVLTMTLVLENNAARGRNYQVGRAKTPRSFATQTMRYSGILIILFIALHLYDFTFANKTGPGSVVEGLNDGKSLELFGLVWNGFKQGWRSVIYVLAVASVGLHLSHAIQSVFQTAGFNHERYTPIIKKASIAVGVLVALGFASLPIYVFMAKEPFGV